MQYLGLDGFNTPNRAVCKLDLFERVRTGPILREVTCDAQHVGRSCDCQQQIAAGAVAPHRHIGRRNARVKQYNVSMHARIGAFVDCVVARQTSKLVGIRTTLAVEDIVTGAAVHHIGRSVANQNIIACRALQGLGLDRVHRPDDAIGEFNLFDGIAAGAITMKVVLDTQHVGRACDSQQQIAAGSIPPNRHVGGQDADVEQDRVDICRRVCTLVDDVVARVFAELVAVRTCAAIERIVAGPAVDDVVTGAAVNRVRARRTEHQICLGADPADARTPS